jgi:cystathionine beta-lyase
MSNATSLLHSIPSDPLTGAISVPIYQTSTFIQEAPGINKGYDYSRTNNPTRATLEEIIAKLEHGSTGVAFSSGLAAIDAVVKLLKSGDEVLAVDDIYGGAFRLYTHIYQKFGVTVKYVDTSDVNNVVESISPATRLIWLETPTNPTFKISDIASIAAVAKTNNVLFCVDNTFASPALQNPLDLGADIVVHSATKYLGGHSDLIAGLVITKDPELGAKIKFIQNASGAILGPFDSWLIIRGLETLYLRIRQHCENAFAVAKFLQDQPGVKKVFYPGLKNHHNHEVAARQSRGFGGMVSFMLKEDTIEAATQFVTSTKCFKLAESLGGAKSLLCHPAEMTHKSIPADIRRDSGVSDGLVRLSVGLENVEDLISDLSQALKKIGSKKVNIKSVILN